MTFATLEALTRALSTSHGHGRRGPPAVLEQGKVTGFPGRAGAWFHAPVGALRAIFSTLKGVEGRY